jgi:hypothetical protein
MDITDRVEGLPTLAERRHYQIDWPMNGNFSVVTFEWHGKAYHVVGEAVWRNRQRVPPFLVRPKAGYHVYEAFVCVHHWETPRIFSVVTPKTRWPIKGMWVFEGFRPKDVLDEKALEAENEFHVETRNKPLYYAARSSKIPRPPRGLVV